MSRFITFEGVEGAGKSTGITYFSNQLEQRQIPFVLTREPGGTDIGEQIRQLLLSKDLPEMHGDTETLLMFAARAEHMQRLIRPNLKQGNWVLCDRFTDATYSYQGAGRGLAESRIKVLEQWTQEDLRPDITVLFDLDVETGMKRVKQRGETDRFENQDIAFFNQVRQRYLRLAAEYSDRFRIIDASQSIESVQQQLNNVLDDLSG